MTEHERHKFYIDRDIRPQKTSSPIPFIMGGAAVGCLFWGWVFSTLLF